MRSAVSQYGLFYFGLVVGLFIKVMAWIQRGKKKLRRKNVR
jgi:hypothetical protein